MTGQHKTLFDRIDEMAGIPPYLIEYHRLFRRLGYTRRMSMKKAVWKLGF